MSLAWPMESETSDLVMYMAWLMNEHGAVPYRDFYEMNTPGVFFYCQGFARLIGYSDLAVRTMDLVNLVLLSLVTWGWARKFGWKVVWCAIVLFGLAFLRYGPYMSLQREFLCIILVSTALWLSVSAPRMYLPLRMLITGILFGACAVIRPHAILGLPPILIFQAINAARYREVSVIRLTTFGSFGAAALGCALPIAWLLLYLKYNNALGVFLEIAKNYWPLYCQLDGLLRTSSGMPRLEYVYRLYMMLGHHGLLFLPATAGAYAAYHHTHLSAEMKRFTLLLAVLAAVYSLYAIPGGKYWAYHWLIFLYFMLMLSALCFVNQRPERAPEDRRFAVLAAVIAILFSSVPPSYFFRQIAGEPISYPKAARVEELSDYMRTHLREGDSVQPLDVAGGCILAMLKAEARIATPYLYDFHFYHHVSSPYIQLIRTRFINDLHAARPRLIIDVPGKTRVTGPDTTYEFPELQMLLEDHYFSAHAGNGFIIYERREEWDPEDRVSKTDALPLIPF